MAHPISEGVRSLRRATTRQAWLTGVLHTGAVVLAIALLLGAIDYTVGVTDPGLRLIISVTCLMAFIWGLARYVVKPLRKLPDNVALARGVVATSDGIGEELPAAVAFLQQGEEDALAGSSALRRAVIIKATSQVEGFRFVDVIDRATLRRAIVLFCVPLAVVFGLLIAQPRLVAVAAQRIMMPLGSDDWPRKHALHFVDAPHRLAVGETFEAQLVDRTASLPEEVWIHYQLMQDGEWVEHREPMQRYDDLMVARREGVTQPFQYRAVGGDDDRMPWRRVQVVELPRLRQLEITLHPPDYAAMPVSASDRHIRALAGTGIAITAQSSRPIRSARIVNEQGQSIPARVAADRISISNDPAQFVAEQSARWWLELEDDQRLVGGQEDPISVNVVPDPPPSVSFLSPQMDRYVTPTATVDVQVLAKDNLAVESIVLSYLRSDESEKGEQRLPLFTGPEDPPPKEQTTLALLEPDRRTAARQWDLAGLKLSPGTMLAVHAAATDYRQQQGQTPSPRNLHVVTLEELEDRLAQQQEMILAELARALQQQRTALQTVAEVIIQLANVGELSQQDIDTLRAVQINQRHIQDLLIDEVQGIPARIARLRADRRANGINDLSTKQQLDRLAGVIEELSRDRLPQIATQLTTALKTAEANSGVPQNADDGGILKQSLDRTGEHQDAVITRLEELLSEFTRWAGYRRFAREFSQMRIEQQRLAQQSQQEIGLDQIDLDPQQLDAQARALRARFAQRQLGLARRCESVVQQLAQTADQLAGEEPQIAVTLSDAHDAAIRLAIAAQMRNAAASTELNQMGRVNDLHVNIDDAIREVLNILRNRGEGELRRLVSRIREAESELKNLRDQLDGLQRKLQQLAARLKANPQDEQARRELMRLTRQQQQLKEKTEQMARQLMRLTAQEAGQSAQRAAAQLGQNGDGGDGDSASTQSKNVRAAQQDLEQAQTQLAQTRRKLQQDLAQQQIADFRATLAALADRQNGIVEEITRLAQALNDQGEWTFGQLRSLSDLAEQQELLQEETQDAAEKLSGLTVIQLALRNAGEDMQRAADGIQSQDVSKPVAEAAQSAARRLAMIVAVMGDQAGGSEPGSNGADGGGGGGDGGQNQQNQQQSNVQLAELYLLKMMQQDLQQQTQVLEAGRDPGGAISPEDAVRYQELAQQQGELAKMVTELLRTSEAVVEDDDLGLPDLEQALQEEIP